MLLRSLLLGSLLLLGRALFGLLVGLLSLFVLHLSLYLQLLRLLCLVGVLRSRVDPELAKLLAGEPVAGSIP
jgi:hypothetical protein